MKYDADKGDQGQLFDANGEEIPYAIRCDTDTGLVVQYKRGANGAIEFESVVDEYGNTLSFVKTVTHRHPAPLYFKPLERT